MDLGLGGRRAFVTASSGGIGAEIARQLAAEGCRVLVHGRDPRRTSRVAAALPGAAWVVGDLTDDDQAAGVVARALEWGTEVLVHNAGPFAEHDWSDASPDAWARTLDGNVGSLVRVVAPLLESMTARGWGRVVTLGSRAATTPLPTMAGYSAAKAAVVNLTVGLARHLAGTGVTANVVSPGVIATDGLRAMLDERSGPTDVHAYADVPVGRLGTPADVAAAVAFLCGEPAGYVTGTELRVDGGITGVA